MSGYVRIHRSLLGHPAFRNEAEAMAFAWLILKAAWRPTRVRYKGHDLKLERGQVAVSIRDFADAMDRPKGWVERLLERLIDHEMVEKSRTQVGTQVRTRIGTHGGTIGGTPSNVITICNYDDFQGETEGDRTPRRTPGETGNGTRAGQTPDTEQVKEEGKKSISVAKATSPRTWVRPDGVSQQIWSDLLANRKRKRQSNTPTAWKKFQDDLTRISAQTGIPPPELIEQCAAKGWGAIYDPRTDQHDRRPDTLGRHQPADGLSSTTRAAIAVFGR